MFTFLRESRRGRHPVCSKMDTPTLPHVPLDVGGMVLFLVFVLCFDRAVRRFATNNALGTTRSGQKVRGVEKFSVLIELLPRYLEDEEDGVEEGRIASMRAQQGVKRAPGSSIGGLLDLGGGKLKKLGTAVFGGYNKKQRQRQREKYAHFQMGARSYLNGHRARRYSAIVSRMHSEQSRASPAASRGETGGETGSGSRSGGASGRHSGATASQGVRQEQRLRVNHLHYEALLFEHVNATARQILLDSPYFEDYYEAQKVDSGVDSAVKQHAFAAKMKERRESLRKGKTMKVGRTLLHAPEDFDVGHHAEEEQKEREIAGMLREEQQRNKEKLDNLTLIHDLVLVRDRKEAIHSQMQLNALLHQLRGKEAQILNMKKQQGNFDEADNTFFDAGIVGAWQSPPGSQASGINSQDIRSWSSSAQTSLTRDDARKLALWRRREALVETKTRELDKMWLQYETEKAALFARSDHAMDKFRGCSLRSPD